MYSRMLSDVNTVGMYVQCRAIHLVILTFSMCRYDTVR